MMMMMMIDIHCFIDLITLPINYYTQCVWRISELVGTNLSYVD